MTLMDMYNLLNSQPYDFLFSNPHLNNNIILLGLGGSYAYGTNIPSSDLDIRGIALNSKSDILLNQNFDQVCDKITDTTIYSFNKIISLLSNCNPNTIEILGLNPNQYLFISPIGQELLDNKSLFISQNAIKSFGGYANQQLYRLNQLCSHQMPQADLEHHILKTIDNLSDNFIQKYNLPNSNMIKLFIDNSDNPEMQKEIFMDINLSHYPLRDYVAMWSELQNIVKSYNKIGKRNDNALEHGKISKHMMHLIRLDLMCLDILEKGQIITYREKEHDLLMSIRNGIFISENNQVKPEFYDLVHDLEKRLDYAKLHTSIPKSINMKLINDFTYSVNERIITDSLPKSKFIISQDIANLDDTLLQEIDTYEDYDR